MVPKITFAIDYYLKEGLNDKFKSIIEETLIDTQEREKILNIYTNFFKSFKNEEILREFNEIFSILISK